MTDPRLFFEVPHGQPGIEPRWTSSAKTGVGTACGAQSNVWFTISHGIINEVYYPTVDQANTRDLGFLVADGHDFFSEEKRDARSQTCWLAQGVPAYQIVNTCMKRRDRIEKVVLTDPRRDVLLQKVTFQPLRGSMSDYGLFALLAPHIGNRGYGNDAWIGDYKGAPMLFARRENTTLALACSAPSLDKGCGYVGFSDG